MGHSPNITGSLLELPLAELEHCFNPTQPNHRCVFRKIGEPGCFSHTGLHVLAFALEARDLSGSVRAMCKKSLRVPGLGHTFLHRPFRFSRKMKLS